jgi:hypothetical protein
MEAGKWALYLSQGGVIEPAMGGVMESPFDYGGSDSVQEQRRGRVGTRCISGKGARSEARGNSPTAYRNADVLASFGSADVLTSG